jgi:uncharacterized phiE125 gp8 family phage protein
MHYARTVAPTVEPVSLQEAKAHLRVNFTDDDALIAIYIKTAVAWLEGSGIARDGVLGGVMVNQTWRLAVDGPTISGVIPIEHGPVISITEIRAIKDGVATVWPATNYRLGRDGSTAFVILSSTGSWPDRDDREDALQITYLAGYGEAPADVPAPLRAAIMLMVGHFYANREAGASGRELVEIPFGVAELIAPYRALGI